MKPQAKTAIGLFGGATILTLAVGLGVASELASSTSTTDRDPHVQRDASAPVIPPGAIPLPVVLTTVVFLTSTARPRARKAVAPSAAVAARTFANTGAGFYASRQVCSVGAAQLRRPIAANNRMKA
jgi:hypothetical protein